MNGPAFSPYLVAVGLVLTSGFLHAVWNLFTKKSVNKSVFLWLCQWTGAIVYAPWVIALLSHGGIPQSLNAYLLLLASVLIHGAYVILLAAAYTLGELSQVYPIMRGTSPMLVPLLSVAILHQQLGGLGWFGVGAIVIGILLISGLRSLQMNKAVALAAAVGISIASYIIVDAVALDYWHPAVLNEATSIGNGLTLTYAALRSRGIREEWSRNGKTALLGGVMAPGGYMLFLFAVSLAPVGHLAPMREIGTVFGTLLGIFILQEKQAKSRLLASVLITAGVILLGWSA